LIDKAFEALYNLIAEAMQMTRILFPLQNPAILHPSRVMALPQQLAAGWRDFVLETE
jgi:hypothetical protein